MSPPCYHLLAVYEDDNQLGLLKAATARTGLFARVDVARNGEQAFSLLEEALASGGALPNIVVSDLRLPTMDGFSLLEAIKGELRLRVIPVVIMSGSDEPDDIRKAIQKGCVEFLSMPNSLEEMVEVVAGLPSLCGYE